jgi:hypothetical protein
MCVPTIAAVLMHNMGLLYFRRGNLKKAETALDLAYSSVGSYEENIGDHGQFLVEVTIVILDLLRVVKICRMCNTKQCTLQMDCIIIRNQWNWAKNALVDNMLLLLLVFILPPSLRIE